MAFQRRRLGARLDGLARRGGALWLCGPPGSGKTTLVGSWLEARKLPAAWLRVDESDDDPATFFHYLAASARAASRRRLDLPVLAPEQGADVAPFARRFFRALYAGLPARAVLVLDDCHQAAQALPFATALRAALEELPAGRAMLLVSRGGPPPALTRLATGGALPVLGARDLELTLEEALGIARTRGFRGRRAQLDELFRATHGWVAGLVLALARAEQGRGPSSPLATADDYFLGEVLERAAPETRRVLLEAALLDAPTASLVERVIGAGAGRQLSALARRGLFTLRHAGDDPAFEFHALFRRFLLARGREELPPGRADQVRRAAAAILAQRGGDDAEAALALLAEAGAWEELARLVAREAGPSLAAGRGQTVLRWVQRLPREVQDADPWLLYWGGAAQVGALIARDAAAARLRLGRAQAEFERRGDALGVWLAWTAATDAVLLEWRDFQPLAAALDEFDRLRERFPFPSPEVAAGVITSAFTAAQFSRLDHPALPAWAEALRAIATGASEPAKRVAAGWPLVVYDGWLLGEPERARSVVRSLGALARGSAVPPGAAFAWIGAEILFRFGAGDFDEALATVEEGAATGEHHGIRMWDSRGMGRAQQFFIAHARGEPQLYQRVAAMERALPPDCLVDRAVLPFTQALEALARGDAAAAVAHAEEGLARATACAYAEAGLMSQMVLARARPRAGDRRGGARQLEELRRVGARIGSAWIACVAHFVEAEHHLDRAERLGADGAASRPVEDEGRRTLGAAGGPSTPRGADGAPDRPSGAAAAGADRASELGRARSALAAGFALVREKKVHPQLVFPPSDLARLCAAALDAGVEANTVRALVRDRGLPPPPRAGESWPWPLRVRALGTLAIERDGAALAIGPRPPRKPLELLALLVAHAGAELPEHVAAEALWPDAEGDAAQHALETTLYRLRRLVGQQTVLQRSGRLSLAPGRCWADVIELEALLGSAWRALERRGGAVAGPAVEAGRIAELYRGPLLAGETAGWAVRSRERLRRRLGRLLSALAHRPEVAALEPRLRAADPHLDAAGDRDDPGAEWRAAEA